MLICINELIIELTNTIKNNTNKQTLIFMMPPSFNLVIKR